MTSPSSASDPLLPPPAFWQLNLPDAAIAFLRVHRARAFAAGLYQNAPLLVLAMWLLGLVDSPLLLFALLIALLVFFARWLGWGAPLPVTRVNAVVLVLALALLVGMLRAPSVLSTVFPVTHIVTGIVTFFVAVDYAHPLHRVWNVTALLLLLGMVCAFATPYFTQPPGNKFFDAAFLFHSRRLAWLGQVNPNIAAGLFATLVPLALSSIFSGQARYRRIASIALGPIVVMLLLLQARGAWIAALIGVAVWIGLYKRAILALVPIVLVAFVALTMWAEESSLESLRSVAERATISLEGRVAVWQFAVQELARAPLGIGVGEYTRYAAALGENVLAKPQQENAHNAFLQAGLDTGIFGLAAFAALWGYAFYGAWHAVSRHVKQVFALGLFAAFCAALVSGMLEANWWSNGATVFIWTLFALSVVLARVGTRRRGIEHEDNANAAIQARAEKF